MKFSRRTPAFLFWSIVRFIRTFLSRDPVLATPEVQSIRELRCLDCPHHLDGQCTICTCVISLKTMIAPEKCPLPKPRWREQTRFSNGL